MALTVLVVTGIAQEAWAGCTDTPAPGVNWIRCFLDRRQFVDVDLTGARLGGATFARTDLSGADLSKVDGRSAKFLSARLEGTRFDEARLNAADFTRAQARGASFAGADLRRAAFFRADLRAAVFTGARMEGTDMQGADLSGATWTDGARVCAEGSVGQCN